MQHGIHSFTIEAQHFLALYLCLHGFVKLAMRNMVRKGRQSLVHFGLTALGLTGFLVLIAWLGRPQLPHSED